MKPALLQICRLFPAAEAALEERYTVHRMDASDDAAALLGDETSTIRGVVTGGHIGMSAALFASLPALEIVAINGVGFDKVDLDAAKRGGVRVSNTPDVLTDDVADLAVGLTIALLRRLVPGDAHVRQGLWPAGDQPLASKVSGRRVGILGLGRIGQAIARRFEGFDCEISYTGRGPRDVPYRFHDTARGLGEACDIFVIAAAASAQTRNIVDREVIDAIGPRGVLVNVARGSLVDEPALIEALGEKRIGGAALDVFADEPNVPPALLALPNVVLTPHVGSATHEARAAMGNLVLANLDAHFAGRPMPTALV